MTDAWRLAKDLRLKVFWLLWIVGMLGVATMLFYAIPNLPPGIELPLPLVVAIPLGVVQSALLLGLAVWAGTTLGPRVGLSAPAILACLSGKPVRRHLRQQVPFALLGGLLVGASGWLWQLLWSGHLPPEFSPASAQTGGLLATAAAILYGGLTEELLLRWGLMTFLVWALWRLLQKARGPATSFNYWAAILVSAVLFGAGHLPAVSRIVHAVSASVVLYILIGNAVGGLVWGWLYWKRGIEAAMVSHMAAHVVGGILRSIIARP